MMVDRKIITGIILSGGKSSRMGSDKGFMKYNGKAFIQHSIDALNPLVTEIIIVSNNADYDVFGLKRIEDIMKNAGPLAGLYSGLKESKTDYNLVLSCDIPLIKTVVLQKLVDAIDEDSEIIQIESQQKNMPLIALYKKQCKRTFLELLNKGERRLQFAVDQCLVKHVILHENEWEFVQNINTPEQLNAILK